MEKLKGLIKILPATDEVGSFIRPGINVLIVVNLVKMFHFLILLSKVDEILSYSYIIGLVI